MTKPINFGAESGYPGSLAEAIFGGSSVLGAGDRPSYLDLPEYMMLDPSASSEDLAGREITDEPKQADVEKFARIHFVDKDNPGIHAAVVGAAKIGKGGGASEKKRIKKAYNEKIENTKKLDIPINLMAVLTITAIVIGIMLIPTSLLGGAILLTTIGIILGIGWAGLGAYQLVKREFLRKDRDITVALVNRVVDKIASNEEFKAELQTKLDKVNKFHAENPDVKMDKVIKMYTI